MLHSTEEIKRIEELRPLVEKHRQMPRLKRLGTRLVGHYPTSAERELVRRYSIGQYSRMTENIVHAIDLTAEVDGIIRPKAYRKEKTGKITTFYSRTISPLEGHLSLRTLIQLQSIAGIEPSTGRLPFLGVFKSVLSKYVHDAPESIGLITVADRHAEIVRIAVPEEVFDSLPDTQRENFEAFTGKVAALQRY